MPADVLIYVEHEVGQPKRIALELATRAAELAADLGGKALAVALGSGARDTVDKLGEYGIDELLVNDGDAFDQYLTEPHVEILSQIMEQRQPQTVLFPNSPDGRDIAPRLCARLNCGVVANVVDLAPADGHVIAKETVFGGNYLTTVKVKNSSVAVFLVRPNAFTPAPNPKSATVQQVEYTAGPAVTRARKGSKVQEEGAPTPLEEASIIVSGGRGLGGPEPFELLEQLAKALGGSVGASRAAVDAGWISYPHQVGQTGRAVKPQLYIAIGISGAVQHRVGMQTADTIVAVNKDPDAPIFQLADLGVVGDLFQIVPALTQEVRRRKGE